MKRVPASTLVFVPFVGVAVLVLVVLDGTAFVRQWFRLMREILLEEDK